MMKLIRTATMMLLLAVASVSLFSTVSIAADRECIKDGQLTGCRLDSKTTLGIPNKTFAEIGTNIVNILGIIAGVTSVIFLILGGINYITSEGDPSKLKGAKSTITYAIAGLAVSILAPAIVGFVLTYSPK